MGSHRWIPLLAVVALLVPAGCPGAKDSPPVQILTEDLMFVEITSTAFQEGGEIPRDYTADGKDASPSLEWNSVPAGTKSVAIICDDPDAPMGTWVHWVIWGLPPGTTSLDEGVPPEKTLPGGARQGTNDFRKIGYGGPAPPPGAAHRYFFKLYALDSELALEAGATKADLTGAMKGHILAKGQLTGTYKR